MFFETIVTYDVDARTNESSRRVDRDGHEIRRPSSSTRASRSAPDTDTTAVPRRIRLLGAHPAAKSTHHRI